MIFPGDLSGFRDEQLVECLRLLRQDVKNFEFEIDRRDEEARRDAQRKSEEQDWQDSNRRHTLIFLCGMATGGTLLILIQAVLGK